MKKQSLPTKRISIELLTIGNSCKIKFDVSTNSFSDFSMNIETSKDLIETSINDMSIQLKQILLNQI